MDVPVTGTHANGEDGHPSSYNLGKGVAGDVRIPPVQVLPAFRGQRGAERREHGEGPRRARSRRLRRSSITSTIPTRRLTYGVTDRLSVSADLPYFHALRRSPVERHAGRPLPPAPRASATSRHGRYWLGNPAKQLDQNLSVGLGNQAADRQRPCGGRIPGRVDARTARRITERRPVDQSIQPGDGGYGIHTGAPGLQVLRKSRGLRLGKLSHQSEGDRTTSCEAARPRISNVGSEQPLPVDRGSVRGPRGRGTRP